MEAIAFWSVRCSVYRIAGVDAKLLHVIGPALRPGHDFVEVEANLPADATVWHPSDSRTRRCVNTYSGNPVADAIRRASRNFVRSG